MRSGSALVMARAAVKLSSSLSGSPVSYTHLGVHMPLVMGLHVVIIPNLDPDKLGALIGKHKPEHMFGVCLLYTSTQAYSNTMPCTIVWSWRCTQVTSRPPMPGMLYRLSM